VAGSGDIDDPNIFTRDCGSCCVNCFIFINFDCSEAAFKKNGAEEIILGCTRIPLLIKNEDSDVAVLDTTTLHAGKAVKMALE